MSSVTGHQLSLAHLTLFDVAPPDLVSVAAAAGFERVGIRVTPSRRGPAYPMEPGSAMLRETRSRLDSTGLQVLDIEVIRLTPEWVGSEQVLETASVLGAQYVIVAIDDPDPPRATDRFAALCEAAAGYGLGCVLEFMVFSSVRTLQAAVATVLAAQHANAGVLVDALHLARSGGTVADVARVPSELLPYAQLCDAPDPGVALDLAVAEEEARFHRSLTGAGRLPLVELVAALPASAPLSLEIPDGWSNPNPLARAQAVLAAATNHLLDVPVTP